MKQTKIPFENKEKVDKKVCAVANSSLRCFYKTKLKEVAMKTIGHFRITFGLFFKASPGAPLSLWKFIHMQMKTNFHKKDEHQDSLSKRGQR